MKFKKVYLFGGTNGKTDDTDYIIGYKAENGKYIEIVELIDGSYHWYKVDNKEFFTLKSAKSFVESL